MGSRRTSSPGSSTYTSGNEFPLRVAKGYSDLKIDTPLIEHIRAQISKHQIDVAILDPLVTLHNVSESDNNRMDTVVRIFAGIAAEQDCAFELEHHMRKLRAGDTDFDGDDMRGASAIHDAVRSQRVLNHMSATDAVQLAIPEHERLQYFRVDKAKGNNAPPSPGGMAPLRKRRPRQRRRCRRRGAVHAARPRRAHRGHGRGRGHGRPHLPGAARAPHAGRHRRKQQAARATTPRACSPRSPRPSWLGWAWRRSRRPCAG